MKSVSLIVVLIVAPTLTLRASCIRIDVNVPEALQGADLVLLGTVLKSEPDSLVLAPERVWKGRPGKRPVTIDLAGRGYVGEYRFLEGKRYLIFARVVPDSQTFSGSGAMRYETPRGCGDPQYPLSLVPQLERIAKGHRP